MYGVMTGRDAKTPIRDRNYMQIQRDDYTSVMTDFSNTEGSGIELEVTENTLTCDISLPWFLIHTEQSDFYRAGGKLLNSP